VRVASLAALTHGAVAVLLVLATGRVISLLGLPTGAGAWVEAMTGGIVAAIGALYVGTALRGLRRREIAPPEQGQRGSKASRSMLAIAMGLLPCPLTIIFVGSAVARGATGAGIALAAGISIGAAITIAYFGLLGIARRRRRRQRPWPGADGCPRRARVADSNRDPDARPRHAGQQLGPFKLKQDALRFVG